MCMIAVVEELYISKLMGTRQHMVPRVCSIDNLLEGYPTLYAYAISLKRRSFPRLLDSACHFNLASQRIEMENDMQQGTLF